MTNNKPNACRRAGRDKSSATAEQYDRIVSALRIRPQSTEDLNRAGIYRVATRIKELNDRYGYVIDSEDRISIVDAHGYPHSNVALYELLSEPNGDTPEWSKKKVIYEHPEGQGRIVFDSDNQRLICIHPSRKKRSFVNIGPLGLKELGLKLIEMAGE